MDYKLINKNIIYIFILRRQTIVCSRNTVRENSHISFFCGGDPFCEEVRRLENTHEELTSLVEWPAGLSFRLRDQQTSPLCLSNLWISAFSPKLQTLYCLFKSHAEVWISSSPHVFFCLWLVIRTYILPFFSVIWWSYLRTEISVTLSIGNKLYSFSCETTLLMLSCDRIESVKFIVAS